METPEKRMATLKLQDAEHRNKCKKRKPAESEKDESDDKDDIEDERSELGKNDEK